MDNKIEDTFSETESKTISDSMDQSLAFRILEEDFSHVTQELCLHDRLGHFANEFYRVMDALRDTHARVQELSEQNKALREQVIVHSSKLAAAAKLSQSDQETIEKLEEEVDKAWKMIDAAQTREQIAQETIEMLRLQSNRLSQELETIKKMGSEQDQEVGTLSKNKEALAREKERLLGEITAFKEKYANAMIYQEEIDKKNEMLETKLAEITTELEAQKSEVAKEKRLKETLEDDLKEMRNELFNKDQEYTNLTIQATHNSRMMARIEHQLREERIANDKLIKEINELQNTVRLMKMEYEQLSGKFEEAQQSVASKTQDVKLKEDEITKILADLKKLSTTKDSLENRVTFLMAEKRKEELRNKELHTKHNALEKDVFDLKKSAKQSLKVIDDLTREKTVITRNVQKANAYIQEQKQLISLHEYNKQKLQEELNEQIHLATKQKTELSNLQNEKERLYLESMSLNTQIQQQMEELKLKEMAAYNYKKKLHNAEAKIKLQVAMYEQVRAERNQLTKSLTEANDEINELKYKLKVKTYQVEQLKEEIRTKESMLVKEDFATKKITKEKEELKMELQNTVTNLREKKEEVAVLIQEDERLQKILQEADKDKARLSKELSQISNERDILGTQLVRRNDELELLYEKIKILQSILQKGEAQYGQRLEDIRLLKIEIKKLRQEKAMLARSMNNMSDLRQELFHVERNFTRERLKCRALEEELQNPLNVHRWRKLEGSDPTTFELIQKIHILQKRLLAASEEAIKRESKLKETERLYFNLRKLLARQPGPEVLGKLRKYQDALKIRGVKMKCLVAELTMFETQMTEYKFDKEQANKQAEELRKKYLNLKKKEYKIKQRERELAQEKAVLPVMEPISAKQNKAKFVGAGFNVASTPCVAKAVPVTLNA